jgi:hypothetical protein
MVSFWTAILPVALLSTIAGVQADSDQPAPPLPKILVAPDHRGFVTASGQRYLPMGVTYYRPGTGWAPQVWKQFDATATRRDFEVMKSLGVTCVRVFLSYGSFYRTPGQVEPDALTKFDQFLEIAEHAGIYVQPTGPDLWEGPPLLDTNCRRGRADCPKLGDLLEVICRALL